MNKEIKIVLQIILMVSSISILAFAQHADVFNVKDFGAVGDGVTLETKSIQQAIDKCAGSGGCVYFPAGKYLTGSLELKSNVGIYIQKGATILGSTKLGDYFPRVPHLKSYNDHFLKYSLFYAEKAENISIRGDGTIDGQGSYFKVKTKVKPDRYLNRPFIIRFVSCKNAKVEDLTLQNSAMWMQQYLACEELTIRGIKVFNHANQNNDMMDIDGCKNVIISDCLGDTDDDGITLKSTSPAVTENVAITNCIISSHCNAIKLGTESTGGFKNIVISNIIVKPSENKTCIFGLPAGICGIALTNVDGGILDGVTISNIRIDGAEVPIFLRLGNRARKYAEDVPVPKVGTFKNVSINNAIVTNAGTTGCSITGIPGYNIENVSLNNISITLKGKGTIEESNKVIPELEENYPESTMWGSLPSYGFFIRHAKNILLQNIELKYINKELRPAIFCDDVAELNINLLRAECDSEAKSLLDFTGVRNAAVSSSKSTSQTKLFLNIAGDENQNIMLTGNDFSNCYKTHNALSGEVILTGNVK